MIAKVGDKVASYATVRPTFWSRGSGKELRGDAQAQVLALYLMTCQHSNMCGIFYVGIPTISHETGLEESAIPGIFSRLEGIAEYDFKEELCFLPNMAKHQIGDELKCNDKRKPKLLRELQQFVGHHFFDAFFSAYAVSYELPDNKGHLNQRKPPVRLGKVRSSKGVKRTLPDDWEPRQAELEIAVEERLDPTRQTRNFKDNAHKHGWKYVDWDAAFRNYLRSSYREHERIKANVDSNGINWSTVDR